MLLKCDIVVSNRLSPDGRKCHATISIGKKQDKSGSDIIYFLVHTTKNKSGMKYQVKNNIISVHQKFVEEGKCTLKMKDPPHNLIISNANTNLLKKFLHILKLAYKGEDTSSVVDLTTAAKLTSSDLEKPKTTLEIFTRRDYPILHSFPSSLETLKINSCDLKRFDNRFLKLQNLRLLDLSENLLSTLCQSLDTLQRLSSIALPDNKFEEIPNALFSDCMINQLHFLDFSGNMIKYLPYRLTHMNKLTTLKLSRNQIEYLPSTMGQLKTLTDLSLDKNKLSILPWSFSMLTLNFLDLSLNLFGKDEEPQLRQNDLSDVPSLFELAARFIIKARVPTSRDTLPAFVLQRLENVKFCPCGSPCLSHCVPYVKTLDLNRVSSSITYDQFLRGSKNYVKLVGYLCSKRCYMKWLQNPNTLFTSVKKR